MENISVSIINMVAPTGEGFGWFLTRCISYLAQVTSSIALAVILFTVILKLITLPFDAYSRVSMRKNSIKMEEMRPELEKLQRQYAGDKNLYQQKMMALYKKNGYSMWGACLPTIVTLVIFIIAINAFNDFSRFQNRNYIYNMSISYNEVIYDGIEQNEYAYFDKDNNKYVLTSSLEEKIPLAIENGGVWTSEDGLVTMSISENIAKISTKNGYSICRVEIKDSEIDPSKKVFHYNQKTIGFEVIESKIIEKNVFVIGEGENAKTLDYAQMKSANDQLTVSAFLDEVRAEASAYTFRDEMNSFLWVKNIWVQDSPLYHPIDEQMANVQAVSGCGSCNSCDCSSLDDNGWSNSDIKDDYAKLISKLDKEKEQPNGYFILVILTAGTSLLLQLITSKSQKAQMELQTVDGQGAQQQKMMNWMMPIMMAVFAFMYTAAFSIYIILSSVISLLTTVLINAILNKKYGNEKKAEQTEVIRGRVYIPKEEPKKEEPKKAKNAIPDNDFLSGKADKKKHIRGRLK